jgi:glycosyltransferase involved in cell wall biosynthesis
MTPNISIIIPTYNCGSVVSFAIASVLNQTYSDFEIVIIDGLSEDNTVGTVNNFNDSRIKVYSEKDGGIYDAMNKGINRARGKWTYFLGSDDLLFDNFTLQKVSESLNDTEAKLVYGNVLIKGDSIWARDGQLYKGIFTVDDLLVNNICHQAIFYRTDVLKTELFNILYAVCADWDLNMRFFSKYAVCYIEQTIAIFSSNGISSFSRKDKFIDNDILENIHKYFKWSLFNRRFCSRRILLKRISSVKFTEGNLLNGFYYLSAFYFQNLIMNKVFKY